MFHKQSESISKIMPALLEFHKNFDGVAKDSKNPMFRSSYMSLDKILEVVKPLLAAQGIILVQQLCHNNLPSTKTVERLEGEVVLRGVEKETGRGLLSTFLYHKSGEFLGSYMLLEKMDGNRGTNKLQEWGGGITYLRRYAICAILAINAEEDRDGNVVKPKKVEKKTVKAKKFDKLKLTNIKSVDELNKYYASLGEEDKKSEEVIKAFSQIKKIIQ